eukprot:5960887-Amphidinium_carterae.1
MVSGPGPGARRPVRRSGRGHRTRVLGWPLRINASICFQRTCPSPHGILADVTSSVSTSIYWTVGSLKRMCSWADST